MVSITPFSIRIRSVSELEGGAIELGVHGLLRLLGC
jgi:hypothetical protein